MRSTDTRHLVMPTVSAGVLMAAYLLMRPYGDATSSTSPEAAAAFASGWWVVAHLAGALALVQLARLGLRIDDLLSTTTTMIARWSGLSGAALVLPFFGAETFGLHAIGRLGRTDPAVLSLVEDVRGHPAALTTFGIGLALLAVSGVSTALAWQGATRTGRWAGPPWAAWPLGIGATLVLPQFYLPPTGRMAFGVAFGIAALILAAIAARSAGRVGEDTPLPPVHPEPATAQ
ncbi:MAG: hypothetical protein WA962_10520 [Ornithinimicrobium sp.]